MITEINSADLRNRTVKGVSWSAFSQLITQLLIWVISMVLARILGPQAYGLVAMTGVFTGFATLFTDSGLGGAIVQRRNLEKRHLDSAFWINVVMGGGMTLLMIALAPVIARFYGEPRLTLLTQVISFQFFLSSLNVVQRALLKREMRFRALGKIQITTATVGGVTGLAVACSGGGVWSLVAQMLAGSTVGLLFRWRVGLWRPSWAFDLQACKDLFGFSAYVLGFNVVNYWGRHADNLLIGRFIGPGALGIYARAYSMMLLPLTQVSRVVGNVMTPALSSIQEDKTRVKRSYLKTISVIGLLTFPIMTGFFVTSNHLILTLLGTKWAEVIPIFKILCGVGLLQSITTTMGWIYQSQGHTRLQFKMGLINSTFTVGSFIVGIHWGVLGVAWAYCFSCLIRCYWVWTVCGNIIDLSFGQMIRTLTPSFVCAVVMGFVVWLIECVLPPSMPGWLFLLVQVPSGILVYVLIVAGAKLDAWHHARSALGQALNSRFAKFFVFFAPRSPSTPKAPIG